MKYVVAFILGGFFGAVINNLVSDIHPDYFVVKIIDSNSCSNPSYSILLKEFSIKVEEDEIFKSSKPDGMNAEAQIYVYPPESLKTKHAYVLVAEYSDCATIKSNKRTVERGQRLYEWIDDEKIIHRNGR